MFRDKEILMEELVVSTGVTAAAFAAYHYFIVSKVKTGLIESNLKLDKTINEFCKLNQDALDQIKLTGQAIGSLTATINSMKDKLNTTTSTYEEESDSGSQPDFGEGYEKREPLRKGEALRAMREGYVRSIERHKKSRLMKKTESDPVINVYRKDECNA